MTRDDFVARFGGVVEHSAFIAARAFDNGFHEAPSADSVYAALATEIAAASNVEQLAILNAHPDLAGKLAIAGELTESSKAEQASAGLDRLSEAEFARFNELNERYRETFGFPFIIAVKGLAKEDILHAFEQRIGNSATVERETALSQVVKIVKLRLDAMFEAK